MRIKSRSVVTVTGGILFLAWLVEAQGQSSTSYKMARSVISEGGAQSTSASYALAGTLGQSSPGHISKSQSYYLGSGFWGATVPLFSVAIKSISFSIAEGVRITWESTADAKYTIYFTESLADAWNSLSTLPGTGGLMEWLDDGTETGTLPADPSVMKRFYRLSGQP